MALPMLPLVARGLMSLAGRMMARNPRIGKNLITLFRGESFPQRNVKAMKDSAKHFKTTFAEMKRDKLGGQWYTPTRDHAKAYASGLFSKIKEIKVTPKELEAFYRYKDKVNKRPMKYSMKKLLNLPDPPTHGVTTSRYHVIVPRYKLKTLPSTTDWLVKEKLRNRLYGIRSLLGI
jgi:hypothetical protein